MAGINAQTILKHNLKKTKMVRRTFLTNLTFQLVLPWIKQRYFNASKIRMKTETKAAVVSILKRHDPTFKEEEQPIPQGTKGKCHICVKDLDNLKGAEKTKKRNKIKIVEYNCSKCGHPACTQHRAKFPASLQPVCDRCLNNFAQMK